MTGALEARWTCRKVTDGTAAGAFHQHSYYDIPVFDPESRRIAVHRTTFAGRPVAPDDRATVGYVDLAEADRFVPLAETAAFSLQQGPLAQWVPGRSALVWSDRVDGRIVARLHDLADGTTRTLPAMVYALSPDGRTGLSLDMDRLDGLRPGYGYAGGSRDGLADKAPADAGVRRIDLDTGETRLILSLATARALLMRSLGLAERARLTLRRPHFWFNHAKIAPDGRRFTVKLRWRRAGRPWSDRQGVSLTVGMDGTDVRILARGTSHVIWEDERTLFFYSSFFGEGVTRAVDAPEGGRIVGPLARSLIGENVHMRALPGEAGVFVYDTPYREEVAVKLLDEAAERSVELARFDGHRPARGPYRCDLHPVPSPDGHHVVVTSPADGGRQVHVISRAS